METLFFILETSAMFPQLVRPRKYSKSKLRTFHDVLCRPKSASIDDASCDPERSQMGSDEAFEGFGEYYKCKRGGGGKKETRRPPKTGSPHWATTTPSGQRSYDRGNPASVLCLEENDESPLLLPKIFLYKHYTELTLHFRFVFCDTFSRKIESEKDSSYHQPGNGQGQRNAVGKENKIEEALKQLDEAEKKAVLSGDPSKRMDEIMRLKGMVRKSKIILLHFQ